MKKLVTRCVSGKRGRERRELARTPGTVEAERRQRGKRDKMSDVKLTLGKVRNAKRETPNAKRET
jgi:hypothetical protein